MLKRINDNKKGFIVVLIAILSLFFVSLLGGVVNASPLIIDSVDGADIFEFNKYPLGNYTLDFYYDAGSAFLPWNWGDNAVKVLGTALNIITNVVLGISNLMCYFVGYIVEQAFSLDFITDILNKIKPMIQNVIGFNENGLMSNGILPGFIMLLILVLGCYLIFVGLLKREVTKAVSSIMTFIVVMFGIVSYSLFADKYLIKLNDFSKEVSTSMLTIGSNIVSTEGKPVDNATVVSGIRERLFQIQIQKPYLLLQYGTSSMEEINESDPNRVSSILNYNSDAKEREEAVKKEVQNGNSNMSISGLASRLGNVILIFFLNVIFSIVILLFAGAMLYYQLLFLFYAIVLPLNFLVGLVPAFSNSGVKGITNLLGSVFKRQGLCLITSLIFTISNFIYDVTDENKYGFLFVFCIQLLLFFVAYIKSHEVLSLFEFVKGNKGSNGKVLNNITNRLRRLSKDRYKSNPYINRRVNNNNNNSTRDDNKNSNKNRNNFNNKYKNKDSENKSSSNGNMKNRMSENNRATQNKDWALVDVNNKNKEKNKERLNKKDVDSYKDNRKSDDIKYKFRDRKDTLNMVKENKDIGLKDKPKVQPRKDYKRRNDNISRNINVNKAINNGNKENKTNLKAGENLEKKYSEVSRNFTSTSKSKSLKKRRNINEERKSS